MADDPFDLRRYANGPFALASPDADPSSAWSWDAPPPSQYNVLPDADRENRFGQLARPYPKSDFSWALPGSLPSVSTWLSAASPSPWPASNATASDAQQLDPVAEAEAARANWATSLSRRYRHSADWNVQASPVEHLDTSKYWGAIRPSRAEPDVGSSYLAPVARDMRWDTVSREPTLNVAKVLSEQPSPTSWGRRYLSGPECYASNGKATCTFPDGREYKDIPVSENFPPYIGPNDPRYHFYDVSRPKPDNRSFTQGIIDDPTPGPAGTVRPATPEGTTNPAAPWYLYYPGVYYPTPTFNRFLPPERRFGDPGWPVKSYTIADQTGRPAVVNVTEPDHPMHPGFVFQTDKVDMIKKEGVGKGYWQSEQSRIPRVVRDFAHDYLWGGHSEDIIKNVMRGTKRH